MGHVACLRQPLVGEGRLGGGDGDGDGDGGAEMSQIGLSLGAILRREQADAWQSCACKVAPRASMARLRRRTRFWRYGWPSPTERGRLRLTDRGRRKRGSEERQLRASGFWTKPGRTNLKSFLSHSRSASKSLLPRPSLSQLPLLVHIITPVLPHFAEHSLLHICTVSRSRLCFHSACTHLHSIHATTIYSAPHLPRHLDVTHIILANRFLIFDKRNFSSSRALLPLQYSITDTPSSPVTALAAPPPFVASQSFRHHRDHNRHASHIYSTRRLPPPTTNRPLPLFP